VRISSKLNSSCGVIVIIIDEWKAWMEKTESLISKGRKKIKLVERRFLVNFAVLVNGLIDVGSFALIDALTLLHSTANCALMPYRENSVRSG